MSQTVSLLPYSRPTLVRHQMGQMNKFGRVQGIQPLTHIDGVTFTDCWQRRETVSLDGVTLAIIGLDDFKANKRATGRLKDLADLQALEPQRDGDEALD